MANTKDIGNYISLEWILESEGLFSTLTSTGEYNQLLDLSINYFWLLLSLGSSESSQGRDLRIIWLSTPGNNILITISKL